MTHRIKKALTTAAENRIFGKTPAGKNAKKVVKHLTKKGKK